MLRCWAGTSKCPWARAWVRTGVTCSPEPQDGGAWTRSDPQTHDPFHQLRRPRLESNYRSRGSWSPT